MPAITPVPEPREIAPKIRPLSVFTLIELVTVIGVVRPRAVDGSTELLGTNGMSTGASAPSGSGPAPSGPASPARPAGSQAPRMQVSPEGHAPDGEHGAPAGGCG